MMDRQPRIKKKDRTGVWVSILVHVGALAIIIIVVLTTDVGQQLIRGGLEALREKKAPPPRQTQQKATTTRTARKVVSDAPPPSGGGRRQTDAPPAAHGEGFFSETTEKKTGAGAGGDGSRTNVQPRVALPPPPRMAVKPFASAPPKSDIKQLYAERAKEAAATEAFGSEQISKTGVSDAGAIIKNVSGATVVDGKYAVIRGLSDRYVTTTFNGAEIPSADPYRRAASLDLFPAQVIDKVVVAKTFTPDQQGSYTGGGINIVSKSFPDRPFANLSIGGSYNTQSTGNEHFLTYDGGAFDWAGVDDNSRALPPSLAAPNLSLNQGVYTVANPPSTAQPPFAERVANNERVNAATRSLGTTQFAPHRQAPPLNHNFSVAVGDTTHLFGRAFGLFASMNYKHDFSFYEDAISRRYEPGSSPGAFEVGSDYSDTRSSEVVNWAGIVNLAYQLFPDHELGFSFLYNQNSDKQARVQEGFSNDDPTATYFRNRLLWTERQLDTFQLKGAHQFPDLGGVKLDWIAALSSTTQEEPDTRFFNYAFDGTTYEIGRAGTPDPKQPTRYFRSLDEDNRNEKVDLSLPFRQWYAEEGEFKLGLFESVSERTSFDRELFYQGSAAFDGNPNSYLTPDNLGYDAITNAAGRINYTWDRYVQNRDSFYDANSTVRAAYLMLDTPLVPQLRLVAGVRLETTEMTVDSVSYLASAITGKTTNSSNIKQTDLLPAVGLIWSVTSNMNVRAHYSQTIARPSFRELAAYRSYDPVLDEILEGNPLLTMSAIVNYDLRYEWFPRPGELISASLFYKDIENAIERSYVTIDQDIVSFGNRPKAKVWGFELEARKGLDFIDRSLRDFTLGGNLSLIVSETDLLPQEYQNKQAYVPDVEKSRPLYDQSPYILNLDLTYDNPRTRTTATLLFNTAGPRIVIAGVTTEDVYEQPAPTLDFILGQKIGRHLSVRFTARNLLNPKIERTYGENSSRLYTSFRRGRAFGLSLGYEF
jgi:TonB-dependent receptor